MTRGQVADLKAAAEARRPRPKRIQRQRIKGWQMPPGAIYVGRPTRWGNPYRVGEPGVAWSGMIHGRGAGRYEPDYTCKVDQASLGALTVEQAVFLYRDELI